MKMTARTKRKNSRGGRAPHALFLFVVLVWAFAGCSGLREAIPYPDTVYVPHPMEADLNLSISELREMYTTSPNRDPDGLGELPTLWRNSHITLNVWESARKRELQNRFAFARTDAEQAKAMRETEAFYRENVVLDGILKSDFRQGADLDWYLPEGIYLQDDRGRKFLPKAIQDGPGKFIHHFYSVNRNSELLGVSPDTCWVTTFRYPFILFSGEAITPETRAVTLYIATWQRRMSFTWIFDPEYVPERRSGGPGLRDGFNRMWGVR